MKAKISEMLLAVSRNYIALGEDLEHKRQLLFGAVSAWNIACLPEHQRERALKKFMTAYRDANPTQTPQDYADVEEDMRQLIERKSATYPEVCSQIINADLREEGGEFRVTVASARV